MFQDMPIEMKTALVAAIALVLAAIIGSPIIAQIIKKKRDEGASTTTSSSSVMNSGNSSVNTPIVVNVNNAPPVTQPVEPPPPSINPIIIPKTEMPEFIYAPSFFENPSDTHTANQRSQRRNPFEADPSTQEFGSSEKIRIDHLSSKQNAHP